MNRLEVINKLVRIEKISDDHFKGRHPFGINAGYTTIGKALTNVEVDAFFFVSHRDREGVLRTTPVTEIVDQTTFKTKNSTYKIELVSEQIPYAKCEQEVFKSIQAAKDLNQSSVTYTSFIYEDIKVMLRTMRFTTEQIGDSTLISW